MNQRLFGAKGFTMFELLIAVVLLSMVFAGTVSVYLSSLKFLKTAQSNDVSAAPVVSLESITKKISFSNEAWVDAGLKQLDIRADYTSCGDFSTSLNTPANTADDNYWHYSFIGGALRTVCDSSQGTTVNAADTILVPNADTAASTFDLINPSGGGSDSVVAIHLVTTVPVGTLDTNVALGAKPKS